MISADHPSPPGPGNLAALAGFALDPLGSFSGWRKKYGPVIGFTLPLGRCCVVYRPEETQQLLLKDVDKYAFGKLAWVAEPVLGDGLIRRTGPEHLAERRLLQPLFDHQHLANYAEVMVESTQRIGATWQEGQVFDLHQALHALTLDNVARVLLGSTIDVELASKAFQQVSRSAMTLMRSPLQVAAHSRLGRHAVVRSLAERQMAGYRQAIRRLDEILHALIRSRRPAPDTQDMLGLLLRARYEDGTPMSDKQIRDELSTFLFAGHDTTMSLLSFVFYLLLRHPRIGAEIVRELRAVLGGRPPTFGDLPALDLTRMVIQEALRLYPPGWMSVRSAREDVMLGGYRVAAGTEVFLSQWLLHRDEAYYPAAQQFDPSRWADPKTADHLEREGKYAPFWFGRKKCIGYQFAKMEATLVLATLLQSYEMELLQDDIKLVAGMVLHPRELRVRVRRRSRP